MVYLCYKLVMKALREAEAEVFFTEGVERLPDAERDGGCWSWHVCHGVVEKEMRVLDTACLSRR